jgi:hypothetical protein
MVPTIDPTSSFDNKKPRFAPTFQSPGANVRSFTPGTAYHSPGTPLSLGGPLAMQTPSQPINAGIHGLNVPGSPFLGMMGFGMNFGGYNMGQMVRDEKDRLTAGVSDLSHHVTFYEPEYNDGELWSCCCCSRRRCRWEYYGPHCLCWQSPSWLVETGQS